MVISVQGFHDLEALGGHFCHPPPSGLVDCGIFVFYIYCVYRHDVI